MWSCRLGIYCNMELVMSLCHILEPSSAQNGIWSSQTALSISWASTQLDGGKARSWDHHLGFSLMACSPCSCSHNPESTEAVKFCTHFCNPLVADSWLYPFPTLSKTGHSSQTPGPNGGDFVDSFWSGFQFPWSNLNGSLPCHHTPLPNYALKQSSILIWLIHWKRKTTNSTSKFCKLSSSRRLTDD